MSLLALARDISRVANNLRTTKTLMEKSGDMVAKEIKENIDRRQTAGQHRPGMVDEMRVGPKQAVTPLAKYTVEKRRSKGVHHDHPLKETGHTYSNIGIRNTTAVMTRVGGRTRKARHRLRKAIGTEVTGLASSDLDREIPPRSPVGYSDKVLQAVLSLWRNSLTVRVKGGAVAKDIFT